jgi:hypothetical protein
MAFAVFDYLKNAFMLSNQIQQKPFYLLFYENTPYYLLENTKAY